jgi:hypothetical protein
MFLKFLYLLLVWGLITAACAGGSYVLRQQDIQPGLKLAGILFAIWLTWRAVRWLFIKYRARARAMQLANFSEEEVGSNQTFWERLSATWIKPGIDQRVTAVLSFLEKSNLSNGQNPRYALPWFVALASRDSQFTDTLNNANIAKPSVDQLDFNSPDFETRWQMHNNGVVISTSDTLVTASPKLDEWQRLVQLLKKKRPANPVNGTLVNLSFKEIEESSPDELRELGLRFRKRIDEAMSTLGINMPVYLTLTGAEAIPGVEQLISNLKQVELDQYFGVLNHQSVNADVLVEQFLKEIPETVQHRCLPYLLKSEDNHELIQLPALLRSYSTKLRAFIQGCFQHSSFQANPDLQGINILAVDRRQPDYPKTIFAKAFHEDVLKAENRRAGILPETEQRRRQFRNVTFVAYLVVLAVLGGGLSYNYATQKSFIATQHDAYAGSFVERQDTELNINLFFRMQEAVDTLDERVWFPWITNSGFVDELQLDYVNRSSKALIDRIELNFSNRAKEELLTSQNVSLMSQYVNTLVDQINWLEAYTTGLRDKELAEFPPPYSVGFPGLPDYVDADQITELNVVFNRYLEWNTDTVSVTLLLEAKRELLERILLEFPGEFSWIIEWANKLAYSERIQLKDYWRGGSSLTKKLEIPGAYTVSGKAAIDALLDSMASIATRNEESEELNLDYLEQLEEFRDSYYLSYLSKWETFLIEFSDGAEVLANQDDWQGFVENLRNAKNPFFLLLTDANNNLIDFVATDYEPDWLYLIDYYNQVLALLGQTPPGGGVNNKAALKTATKLLGKLGKGGKALAKIAKTVQKTQKKAAKGGSSGPSPSEMQLAMADVSELVLAYQQGLNDIVSNSSKRLVSLAAMREHFTSPRNPGGGSTAYAQTWKAINDIETLLGKEKNTNKAFWRVFKGSVYSTQRFLMQEATCSIQEQWEDQYLAQLDGVSITNVPNISFVEGGLLWAFYDAVLQPFVSKGQGVHRATKLDDAPLSFQPTLFSYLNGGSEYKTNNKPFYQVFVEARPISVNESATVLPHESKLTLICPEQEFTLQNNNFRVSEMMQWNDTCQGFELSIAVGRYLLKKQYPGPMGFAQFLREFEYGSKRLQTSEFPAFEDRLANIGIEYFDVSFRFRQHQSLLKRLELSELATPNVVTQCWDLGSSTLAMTW